MTLPAWYDPARVILTVEVAPLLAAGVHPLQRVREALEGGAPGSIVELRSDFEPLPLLELFRSQGMDVWCAGADDAFHTCIRRPGA